MNEEAALLDSLVDEAAKRLVAPGDPPALDAGGLSQLAPPLRRLLLRRLAEQAAGESLALGPEQLAEIEALAGRGGSGSLDLGAELPYRERTILELRYGLGGGQQHTLEEVGRRFGVTRERVRQIETRTLRRLAAAGEHADLRHLID